MSVEARGTSRSVVDRASAPNGPGRGRSARGRGGLGLVERERRREVTEGVDLLLAFGEFLLGLCERVGAGDEPERRLLLVGDGQQRLGELGRVSTLLPVHAVPELALGGVALGVVLDR